MILYHYTCPHAAGRIIGCGELRPRPQIVLDERPLIWLTDLDQPDRAGLGLTSYLLACDRTAYRVTIDTTQAAHWPVYTRRRMRTRVRDLAHVLNATPGAMPAHWWVAEVPLPVRNVELMPLLPGWARAVAA